MKVLVYSKSMHIAAIYSKSLHILEELGRTQHLHAIRSAANLLLHRWSKSHSRWAKKGAISLGHNTAKGVKSMDLPAVPAMASNLTAVAFLTPNENG